MPDKADHTSESEAGLPFSTVVSLFIHLVISEI